MSRSAFAVLLTLACLPALAASPDSGDATAVTVLHCGRLFDADTGRMLGESSIVVRGARIVSVQPGAIALPAGANAIELGQATCLPGLIDSHVHLTSQSSPTSYSDQFRWNVADYAIRSTVYAQRTLQAGFTTVRNLGDAHGVIRSLRDAVNAGKVAGPRILTANTSISATAGHADPTLGFRPELSEALALGNVCDGVESCRRAVRLQVASGADVIKMTITGGVNSRIGAGLGGQMF